MLSQKRLVWTLVSTVIGVSGANLAAAQSVLELAKDVTSIRIESTGQHYTPRQSTTPNGVSRHTSDYTLTVVWEPDAWRAREEWGWSMSHFFLARAGLGAPQDYPETHTVSLLEVGDDIYQIQEGGSSNNLLIVGPDGLAIVDAPWFPERSEAVLRHLAERWPEKPLRYVILTHHHIDHTGGFRGYVQAGATLVTSQDNASFFTSALERAGQTGAAVIAVGQRATLNGIGRTVEVYEVLNSHADGTLVAYVPDARVAFVTDLFSPGRPRRDGVEALWTSELVASMKFHGVEVERYVGGHGAGYGHPDDD